MSFRIENHVLLRYKEENQQTEAVIPDGVEIISRQSFFRAKNLEVLTIPPSVHTIENDAFRACHDLKEIRITEGIEQAEPYAFEGSRRLDKLLYREIPVMMSYNWLPATLKMIAQKNCRASVPDFIRYGVIAAMFFYAPDNEKIIKYIQKDFRKFCEYLIKEKQYAVMEKILYSGNFVNRKNIDDIIRFAIGHQQYEIQTLLISYKNKYLGYQDITEKLKL